MMTREGHIKLADFGISKNIESLNDSVIGTVQYMAPEQVLVNRGYSFAVDIWSFGCCLYEMVAGEPPFTGTDEAEIQGQLQSDVPI